MQSSFSIDQAGLLALSHVCLRPKENMIKCCTLGPLCGKQGIAHVYRQPSCHALALACVLAKPRLVCQVMGHKRLLETNADIILQQKINLRAPYVTPLNVLQARNCLC